MTNYWYEVYLQGEEGGFRLTYRICANVRIVRDKTKFNIVFTKNRKYQIIKNKIYTEEQCRKILTDFINDIEKNNLRHKLEVIDIDEIDYNKFQNYIKNLD